MNVSEIQTSEPDMPAAAKRRKGSLTKVTVVKKNRAGMQFTVRAYGAAPMERVAFIKSGVPAQVVTDLSKKMDMTKDLFISTLGLGRATINRKVSKGQALSADEGSKVMGMARLVGQVEVMVKESGNPEGFNAGKWVADWLERPLPALGGQRPAELMDTTEGQGIVFNLVERMRSGAYS